MLSPKVSLRVVASLASLVALAACKNDDSSDLSGSADGHSIADGGSFDATTGSRDGAAGSGSDAEIGDDDGTRDAQITDGALGGGGGDSDVPTLPSPAAYSLANLTYGGLWLDPRAVGSYTQGLGEISISASGLRLFTELSGKPFVDGELPEWPGLLYSTDQVGTASATFGGALGAFSFVVPAAASAAPHFSVYAQSACTDSTVFFGGYYYTYFEAFETLPTAALSDGGTSQPLYVLALFVGRSTTLEGEREIYVGKDSGGHATWAATPNTQIWAPVVRPYLTTHYQINGDTLGPAGRTPISWLGSKNGVYAAGAPSAVVKDGKIHLFYLDTSYSLAPSPASFVSIPWINASNGDCVQALTPSFFVNGVADGSTTCTGAAPGAKHDPPISIPYSFTVESDDPVTFSDTTPTVLPGMYNSYNVREVAETGDFVQVVKSGTQITLMRSKDGVKWCNTDTPDCDPTMAGYSPPKNPTVADLSSSAAYFSPSGSGLIVSGDAENHVSLASPLYFGIWSSETIPSGNFSMGFDTARLFAYSSQLLASTPAAPVVPSAGPTDHAADWNPTIPLALEAFYTPTATAGTSTFTVCGSDFAPLTNTYVDAFYSDPSGQLTYKYTNNNPAPNPVVYTSTQAAPYALSQPAETYFGGTTGRKCFAIALVNPPTTWNLTLGVYDNSSTKFFAVPVDLTGACNTTGASCFDGTTPEAAPLSISKMTRSADSLTFCGAGLYASRRNLYALLRYTAPTGTGGTQQDVFFFTKDQKPTVDPSVQLTMSVDPTTRLRCGTLPLPASSQALIDQQHWQLVLGVADPDSGQQVRLPVK